MIWIWWQRVVGVEIIVNEVDIRNLFAFTHITSFSLRGIFKVWLIPRCIIVWIVDFTVASQSCTEAAELHHVRGECSSFVWENVRNLAELFVEVWRLNSCWHISFRIVDVYVPCNEHCLREFHDFHGDEERDWDHIGEQEDPSEEHFEEDLEVNIPRPRLRIHAFLWV